jgi:cytochrome c553
VAELYDGVSWLTTALALRASDTRANSVEPPSRPSRDNLDVPNPLAIHFALLLCLGSTGPAGAADAPADSMAQRLQVCSACHGKEGRAASDGYYPRIAGKPQEYLYRQLLNFRERRRGYAPMTHLVKHLSDEYLREIAAYFAQLDLPYSAPQPGPTTPLGLALGADLVKNGDKARGIPACDSCHGTALTGVQPEVPGLVGLPRDYLNAQLGAWKNGLRSAPAPDCMARVAARLGPQDIAAVSMWLASQPVPADPKAVPAAAPGSNAGHAAIPAPCGGLAAPTGKS